MSDASAPSDLDDFIRTAKAADVPDAALVALLEQNGWPARRVYRSLGAWYCRRLGRALPARPATGENARDAFYYLLNFFTLATWTIALGSLFYDLIARTFPDPAAGTYAYAQNGLLHEIAWQLASIVIAFPVFAWLDRTIAKELSRRPEFSQSGVRSWLTYIALVIAALVVIGEVIAFVATFLDGGLSTRFELDTLVDIVIAGGVFAYYLAGMRATASTAPAAPAPAQANAP